MSRARTRKSNGHIEVGAAMLMAEDRNNAAIQEGSSQDAIKKIRMEMTILYRLHTSKTCSLTDPEIKIELADPEGGGRDQFTGSVIVGEKNKPINYMELKVLSGRLEQFGIKISSLEETREGIQLNFAGAWNAGSWPTQMVRPRLI